MADENKVAYEVTDKVKAALAAVTALSAAERQAFELVMTTPWLPPNGDTAPTPPL